MIPLRLKQAVQLIAAAFLLCSFTTENYLRGRLRYKKTGKPVGNVLLLVKQGGQIIGKARTSNKGKYAIDFNSGDGGDSPQTGLFFYAVLSPTDTVLLEQFNTYPARFRKVNNRDQAFEGD